MKMILIHAKVPKNFGEKVASVLTGRLHIHLTSA